MALFEQGHPGIGFVGRHIQTGRSEGFPCLQRILAERLTPLFATWQHIQFSGGAL